MTANTERDVAARLRKRFGELQELLAVERENNWVRGIEACLARLDGGASTPEDRGEMLLDVASMYRSMTSGPGSFSDFHVWRDDFNERARANAALTAITEELWRLTFDIR